MGELITNTTINVSETCLPMCYLGDDAILIHQSRLVFIFYYIYIRFGRSCIFIHFKLKIILATGYECTVLQFKHTNGQGKRTLSSKPAWAT